MLGQAANWAVVWAFARKPVSSGNCPGLAGGRDSMVRMVVWVPMEREASGEVLTWVSKVMGDWASTPQTLTSEPHYQAPMLIWMAESVVLPQAWVCRHKGLV